MAINHVCAVIVWRLDNTILAFFVRIGRSRKKERAMNRNFACLRWHIPEGLASFDVFELDFFFSLLVQLEFKPGESVECQVIGNWTINDNEVSTNFHGFNQHQAGESCEMVQLSGVFLSSGFDVFPHSRFFYVSHFLRHNEADHFWLTVENSSTIYIEWVSVIRVSAFEWIRKMKNANLMLRVM